MSQESAPEHPHYAKRYGRSEYQQSYEYKLGASIQMLWKYITNKQSLWKRLILVEYDQAFIGGFLC